MNKELDYEMFEKLYQSQLDDYKTFSKPKYFNVFKGVVDKYTDTAHFIYELLQNADDAKATDVEMQLSEDKLIFIHNGRERFTISNPDTEENDRSCGKLGHINAITSIGFSTKSFETDLKENKIGKFGVGFKAIFQYTQTPHIYDDGYCFKIENYIVPTILTDRSLVQEGKTVFVIPFDRDDTSKRKAYKDIKKKIEGLNHPQLFLNNILNISWSIKGKKGFIKKIVEKTFEERNGISTVLYHLEHENGDNKRILLFSKIVKLKSDRSKHTVSIGYLVENNGNINTEVRPYINCFFPTRERIDTCYIIHAPFLLVDNREQLKKDNEINLYFLNCIGELSADSLPILRDIQISKKKKLLNDNIISLIHHDLSEINEDLDEENMVDFDEKYEGIFKTENVFLSKSGKYITRDQGWWADSDMQKLLSSEQLCQLSIISIKNPSDFYDYILCTHKSRSHDWLKKIKINIFSDKVLASFLTSDYIQSQDSKWLSKLYSYVHEKQLMVIRPLNFRESTEAVMRYAPIIKNEEGDFIEAYNKQTNKQQIYFPAEGIDNRCAINTTLYQEDENFRNIISDLGVKPLDEYELIKTQLFQKDLCNIEESKNILKKILLYYKKCEVDSSRFQLIKLVREKMRFLCHNFNKNDNQLRFTGYSNLYYNTPEYKCLNNYISNSGLSDCYFIATDYYIEEINVVGENTFNLFIKDLRINENPKVVEDERNLTNDEYFNKKPSLCNRGFATRRYNNIEGFVDNADNLKELENPREMSLYLWNILVYYYNNKQILSEADYTLYYEYRARYPDKYYWEDYYLSKLLQEKKWLYINGELCSISDANINKEVFYSNGYKTCDDLCDILNIKDAPDKKDREAILKMSDSTKLSYTLGEFVKSQGLKDIEELKEIINLGLATKREEENKGQKKRDKSQKTTNKQESLFESVAKREQSKPFVAEDFKFTRETSSRMSVEKAKTRSKTVGEMLEDFDEKVIIQKEEIEKIGLLHERVENTEKYSYGWLKALMNLEAMSFGNTDSEGKKKTVFISFENVYIEKDRTDIVVLKGASRYIPTFLEDSDGIIVTFHFFDNTKQQISFVNANVKEDSLVLKADRKQEEAIKQLILKEKYICSATVEIDKPIELIKSWQNHINNLPFDEDDSLKKALPTNIKFIFGPPGTGKTTTLAKRIIELMEEGTETCRILVLAPTNKACDVLTEKILNLEPENDVWLWRFVATMSDRLEEEEVVYGRQSNILTQNKVCVVSTMARYAFDGFVNGQLKDLDWDYVIIDEASMIPLYQIVAPLYNEKSGEIWIAGDPFQIQPIVNTDEWKDENIYSMVELKDFANPTTTPIQFDVETLMTQYRSIPMIGELFSQYMYGGKLKHYRSNSSHRKLNLGIGEQPLNIVSFPITKDSIFDAKRISKSNIQIYSVIFTVEFIKYIVKNLHKKHENEDIKIGVLSPYLIEIQTIQKLYNQTCEQYANISVNFGTSHSFQGDECDIVIAVLNPPATGMKLAYDLTFINKPNILNVAVSRAQDYLFILMPEKNYQYFSNLIQLNKLCSLMTKSPNRIFTSDELEKKIFGKMRYIENNTFVTSHQTTNVYSDQSVKYEIRIDNNALDVQIN